MASSSSSSVSVLFFSVALLLSSLPIQARTGISFNKITRTGTAAAAVTAPSPAKLRISSAVTDDSDNAFAPVESYAADAPHPATASPAKFTVSENAATDDAFAPATAPGSHNALFASDINTTGAPLTGAADSSISAFEIEGSDAPSSSSLATIQSRLIASPKVANGYYDQYDGKNNFYHSEYHNKGEIDRARETQSQANNYNYNYDYTKSDSGSGNQNRPNYVAEYYGEIEFVDPNLA